MELTVIQERIFEIKNQKVMLDYDLAALYDVETRVFNQAVKRNQKRFPYDFMFRLSETEWDVMKNLNSSQNVISLGKHRGSKYRPYAFTEHGVTMLASILKSDNAIDMNILIVRAFIQFKTICIRIQRFGGAGASIKRPVRQP